MSKIVLRETTSLPDRFICYDLAGSPIVATLASARETSKQLFESTTLMSWDRASILGYQVRKVNVSINLLPQRQK